MKATGLEKAELPAFRKQAAGAAEAFDYAWNLAIDTRF